MPRLKYFAVIFLLLFSSHPLKAQEQLPLYLTVHPHVSPVAIDDKNQARKNLKKVPGNALLVEDKNWDKQRASTIKDMTDYIPGVFTQPRNSAESSRLSIRGSGLSSTFQGRGLLILQDGIPINMADGEFEFPVIDPWLVRYAQVFPGANALEYGASNFGGAINFITPTGLTDEGYGSRVEGGSFGTLHSQASVGKSWEDGDLYAAATGFRQDGFRDNSEQSTGRFNANLGWQANDTLAHRFYISHTRSRPEIPGAISKAMLEEDPRQANPINRAGHFQRDLDITRLASRSAWEEGPDRIDLTLFYMYRALDNPVTTYILEHNDDTGMQAKYTHEFGLDRLISGFNIYYGEGDENRYRNNDGQLGAPVVNRQLYAFTGEMYGQYEQHLIEKLFGIMGTQLSYAARDIEQSMPAVQEQTEDFADFSPRFGLRYDQNEETQFFANLSRSFEPPTLNALSGGNVPGFNQLDAQTATTLEIGSRGAYQDLDWNLAYYHGWLENEFVNYRFSDGSTATINANKTRHDGIELGLGGDIASNLQAENDALTLRLAYTWSHFRLDGDPLYGDNQLPGVPEHYIRAEMLYRHPSGLSFGPNIEWVPQAYPVDLTNSVSTEKYAVLGARTFWESGDRRLSLYIEGRNLFDKHYIATTNVVPDAAGQDGRFFYPGEGRAVFAGLNWKW